VTYFVFLLVLVLALAQVGCATIVCGGSQKIAVESVPQGAHVAIDDQMVGETPLVTEVSRNRTHEIRIRKEGYDEESRVTYKGNNYMLLGNILIGGLIGYAIDLSTGAAYTVEPDRFVVTLTEAGGDHQETKSRPEGAAAQPASPPEDRSPP